MAQDKKPQKRQMVEAKLDGTPVRMRLMNGREIIAIQRGQMKEADVLEMTATAVLFPKEDLGVADPLDLDYDQLAALLDTWGDAMKERALPNSNGES